MNRNIVIILICLLSISTVSGYRQINDVILNETLDSYFEENIYSEKFEDYMNRMLDNKIDEGMMDQQAFFTETWLPQNEIILNLTQHIEKSNYDIITLEDRIERMDERLDTKDQWMKAQRGVIKRQEYLIWILVLVLVMGILHEYGAF